MRKRSLERLQVRRTADVARREDLDDVVKPISELKRNGHWTLKEHPTRLEIDQFLENAKARADAANIPNEAFDLNIADELRKAIRVD